MSWTKGKQGYRLEHSSQELNKTLKELEGSIKEEEAKYLLYKFLRNNIAFTSELFLGVKLFPFQAMAIKGMMVIQMTNFHLVHLNLLIDIIIIEYIPIELVLIYLKG